MAQHGVHDPAIEMNDEKNPLANALDVLIAESGQARDAIVPHHRTVDPPTRDPRPTVALPEDVQSAGASSSRLTDYLLPRMAKKGHPGRHPWKHRPNVLKVLTAMEPGRWYTRIDLREITGLQHNSLSCAIVRNHQRGYISRHWNPEFRRSTPKDYWFQTGPKSCKYCYVITDAGREALVREEARRSHLLLNDFDNLK